MDRDISVIIPTYNRQDYIKRAVNSVIDQSFPVNEIIIADDSSSDETEAVIRSIDDSRVKYYRLPENRGAGAARNFGVSKASYDLIAFHDSDDVWLPQKAEKQLNLMEDHPEYGMVYCSYYYMDRYVIPDPEIQQKLEGSILPELLFRNTIGAPTVLMKREIFYEVGGFDESMRSLEDWDFAIRVAKLHQIGFVSEPLLNVTANPGSVSTGEGSYFKNRCYLLAKHKKDYLETGAFDKAVTDILEKAKENGILDQVNKLLTYYLTMDQAS